MTRARDIMDRVSQAQSSVKDHGRPALQRFRLGAAPTPGALLIPALLRSLSDQDKIQIDLREGLSADLIGQLENGTLEIALCYDPDVQQSLRIEPLLQDDLVLIGPPGHINTNAAFVQFRDLGRFPLILDTPNQITRKLIDRMAQREKVALQIKMELESINLKREFLIAMKCFSIVPLGLFHEAIDAGRFDWAPIAKPCISRTLCLLSSHEVPEAQFAIVRQALAPAIQHWIERGTVNWRSLS